MSALLAMRGLPEVSQILWILLAMVGARSAAMAFNRLVDLRFDARNPRTAGRALPTGHLSKEFVIAFTIASSALLVLSAFMLNSLVKPSDLSRVNAAFFTISGWMSFLLLVTTGIDLFWKKIT
jgi:4-hydroxybenzoate polyprenyltransferase